MHAKPSFAHRLQTVKMASFRTSAQNNDPRAHSLSTSACRPRSRVRAAFLHFQCANRPFWPLVSKYTISDFATKFSTDFTTKLSTNFAKTFVLVLQQNFLRIQQKNFVIILR